VHAAIEFALTVPDVAAATPAVVVLAARDELSLFWLREDAVARGLRVAAFHEPDLDGALTALALEPDAGRLVASLPLALAGSVTSSGREEVRT
jgi:hypothetical protein